MFDILRVRKWDRLVLIIFGNLVIFGVPLLVLLHPQASRSPERIAAAYALWCATLLIAAAAFAGVRMLFKTIAKTNSEKRFWRWLLGALWLFGPQLATFADCLINKKPFAAVLASFLVWWGFLLVLLLVRIVLNIKCVHPMFFLRR